MCSLGDERLPERFWSKVSVNEETGCWEWGNPGSHGYGLFSFGRSRRTSSHKAAYVALVGDVPAGLELDHLCRNRACCNPAHLEPVTHRENLRRGVGAEVARQRLAAITHCPKGHAYAGDNLMVEISPTGVTRRRCRICKLARMRETARRRRARAAAQAREAA